MEGLQHRCHECRRRPQRLPKAPRGQERQGRQLSALQRWCEIQGGYAAAFESRVRWSHRLWATAGPDACTSLSTLATYVRLLYIGKSLGVQAAAPVAQLSHSLLYVPDELLAYVRLEAAAQHQLGIAIQAGLGSIDEPPACRCTTVAGQLLSATEPADMQLCQPLLRPKSVRVHPKKRSLSVSIARCMHATIASQTV